LRASAQWQPDVPSRTQFAWYLSAFFAFARPSRNKPHAAHSVSDHLVNMSPTKLGSIGRIETHASTSFGHAMLAFHRPSASSARETAGSANRLVISQCTLTWKKRREEYRWRSAISAYEALQVLKVDRNCAGGLTVAVGFCEAAGGDEKKEAQMRLFAIL